MFMPIKAALKIFDACISPILLYGSEVWELSPIKKVHTQFLKRMLGVNYSTTNILVRRECGRNPLQEDILNHSINYLKYITNKNNNTVKQALNYERLKEDTRVTMTCMAKQHEEKIGAYHKENENIWNISRLKLKSALNHYFNQLWVEQTPLYIKAGIYMLFKNKVGIEDYLVDITSRSHRVTYTKFRLSDHSLVLEEG